MSTADAPRPVAPHLDGPVPDLLIVRAPYYRDIVENLTTGARAILGQAGATHEVADVAGALELAGAIRLALRGRRRFDGFIALGCVLRGETDHYEHVCREAMSGLTQVTLQFGLCLGNGLLTVRTEAQALARATSAGANNGAEAAAAALTQIGLARGRGAV